jgi:hypothetical protein
MIVAEQKTIITQILGLQYSNKIIAHLIKTGILPEKASKFNPKIIQNIVNGRTENLIVQEQIAILIETTKKERLKANKKLEKSLKI